MLKGHVEMEISQQGTIAPREMSQPCFVPGTHLRHVQVLDGNTSELQGTGLDVRPRGFCFKEGIPEKAFLLSYPPSSHKQFLGLEHHVLNARPK